MYIHQYCSFMYSNMHIDFMTESILFMRVQYAVLSASNRSVFYSFASTGRGA